MKKYVVGAVIGALLMFSGQALADTISNIGKKVSGEYAVYVDGKPIDKKSIGVNGSTFTPNKALGDAIGYDVVFKDKAVYFTKRKVPIMPVDQTSESQPEPSNNIQSLTWFIEMEESRVAGNKMFLKSFQDTGNTEKAAEMEQSIANSEANIAKWKEQLSQLEAQQ